MDERSSLGTVSKRGCFFRNARARNTHVEATLNHPFPAQVYDKRGRGDIPIFYLAKRMSELHDLDEADLLHIFETAGQEPRDLVDADTYVELIKFLLAGDSSMTSVIDLLKLQS